MADYRLVLDAAAVDDLLSDEETLDMLQEVGDTVADLARGKAPKMTGEGAESIHAEVEVDDEGGHADVSWDSDHFYLGFAETGTSHQPATPFLRPALDETTI